MTSVSPPTASPDAVPLPWVADMLFLLSQQNQQMALLMDKLLGNKVAATDPTLPTPDAYGNLVRYLSLTLTRETDKASWTEANPLPVTL
ncbi:unnamed protein product [Nippostrongylus brasiliensis]|uniref:DUF4439 domain-containing protein n=1 Tax=Nippostrongylus brasiliensis TaxID=27835 RepID=A0A0N4XTJ6_NIPBR|nr:unnamed protein product [Nippostrongylus brasiliensis]